MSAEYTALAVIIAAVWWVFGFAWWRMPLWARWASPPVFVAVQTVAFSLGFGLAFEHPWTLAFMPAAGVAGAFVSARLPS